MITTSLKMPPHDKRIHNLHISEVNVLTKWSQNSMGYQISQEGDILYTEKYSNQGIHMTEDCVLLTETWKHA